MERLDQGHLHSKLEVPRLTCLGRELNPGLLSEGEHSSKELLEQCVNSYSEPTTVESLLAIVRRRYIFDTFTLKH
jgi:hypothetical protein